MSQLQSHNNTRANEEEIINILRIIRSENIGPITYYNLLKINNNLAELIEIIPELLKRSGKDGIRLCGRDQINSEIEQTYRFGAEFIPHTQVVFPNLLKEIADCPPILITRGKKNLLNSIKIALVGSRNASHNNLLIAEKWAEKLSKNYIIVSGLARGIDSFAHKAALDNGTIAVIAGGIDIIYPPENNKLYHQIAEQGLIITEMPFGMQPIAKHFPRRNRIISGLSLGVVVIEASLQSGSLITARFAGEQNRDCFAVPGSPLDPRARGTNKLIKEGAYLVESPEEIMEILQHNRQKGIINDNNSNFYHNYSFKHLPNESETLKVKLKILELIDTVPVSADSLLATHNFDLPVFHIALIELELAGEIERSANNFIIRKYKIE